MQCDDDVVNVMLFQWGVVGQYLLAAITSVHLLLFSIIAFEFRTKAPGAKTFLQVIRFRLLLRLRHGTVYCC